MNGMTRYAAFLRGVNVGGVNLKMAEVAKALEEAGFTNVRTILASGNVLLESRKGVDAVRKMAESAEDPRDPEAIVNAFLQHKSMEQMQDYLARGRRFAKLDIGRLNEDWVIAVRSWLAHKHRTKERLMDDLACAGSNHHMALLN